MKLLTSEVRKKLPKLYATENIPTREKEIICKFFNPCGSGTWYVIEGEPKDDDFIFFGLVGLFEKEWGYFSLSELESIKLPFNLKIERDVCFNSYKVSEIWSGI